MIFTLFLKRTFTLFVLVEPIALIPVFLSSVAGKPLAQQLGFARKLALAVTFALIGASMLGAPLLAVLGVPLSAMQVGGGILMLMLSVAMALGKETVVKGEAPDNAAPVVVPLAVPLLAGPAAFSYVIMDSSWSSVHNALLGAVPILIVGLLTWAVYRGALHANQFFSSEVLDLIERLGGFLLMAMAVNMVATGLRGLFPLLAH